MDAQILRETITSCGVAWQCVTLHTTKRDRIKPVLCGIPSALFWHRYRHGLREQMTAIGLTIRRLAKNQWEVCLWPRAATLPIIEDMGFTIPNAAPVDRSLPF